MSLFLFLCTRMARGTSRTWLGTWCHGCPHLQVWSLRDVCRATACSPHLANTTSSSWGPSLLTHMESNCWRNVACFSGEWDRKTHTSVWSTDYIRHLLTTILFLQPAESVLCEEPGCRAEACCRHTGLQQRRSGQSDPLQDPHCCYWCKKQRKQTWQSLKNQIISDKTIFSGRGLEDSWLNKHD